MGRTSAEKALARASGQRDVSVGQIVDASPDRILSHDNTAAIFGCSNNWGSRRSKTPKKLLITLDHAVPAPTTQHAQNHAETRAFVLQQGVKHFFEVGRGIRHQVHSEEALVLPGWTILGSDSHTPHFGWLGALGAGVGRTEVACLWATGELWLRVPESIQIELTGELPFGVSTKDFCLKLIGDLGQDGGLYASVEFTGDGIGKLSLDSRMVIPNMMAEFGAKTAYLPPDEKVFDYLNERLARREMREKGSSSTRVSRQTAIYPDSDAHYLARHRYNLSDLEPMVARPHRVDNVVPVSEMRGTRVQQAWLGTCTNGRLEDIAAACAVLKGKQVSKATRLLWNPARPKCCKMPCDWAMCKPFWRPAASLAPRVAGRAWATIRASRLPVKPPSAVPTATSRAAWAHATAKFIWHRRPWSRPAPLWAPSPTLAS